jgi:rhodanese-related sulfurtransferase
MKTVDPLTLCQWLTQGNAELVDVREPAEYRAMHIYDAHSIPLAKIGKAALPNGSGALVVHCLKGGRGAEACEILAKRNPGRDIYNLAGGITAWEAAGLPVVAAGRSIMPLDRQVQLAVGITLLVFAGLTYFENPLFVLASGAIGLGLAVAGATGFCGMARLLAHAPWNQ